MLEPRKKQNQKPTSLPKDFSKTVIDLFNKQFKKERGGSEFLVYGNLYMNEVLLCVSLTNARSLTACSFYVSVDLKNDISEKPELLTEKLKLMVDVVASWFAQTFEESKDGAGLEAVIEASKDMDPSWQATEWEKEKLFVKINRDNHTLENAANKFLRKAGVKLEEIDEEDDLEMAEIEAALEDMEAEGEFGGSHGGKKKLH